MTFKRPLAPTIAALALALAFYSCAPAEPVNAIEVPPAGAQPGPGLWQLSDGDTTIYLFGTIHVLPDGTPWFDARIERAFTAADTVVTEVDLRDTDRVTAALIGAAALPEGSSLRDFLGPQDRAQYEAAMIDLGLQPNALDRFEPWLVALNLNLLPLMQAGYDPASGVETALVARAGGKSHAALESLDQHVALFDGMEQAQQLSYLNLSIDEVDEVVPSVNEMVTEWLAGDAAALDALLNSDLGAETGDAYLNDRLLINRNANWAGWIAQRMEQPGTVFIAVGAGHLVGAGNVQDQLRQRGLLVTRVWQ